MAHGVARITEKVPARRWRHVDTSSNPAVIVSRCLQPSDLLDSQLWWDGPPWLLDPPAQWPRRQDLDAASDLPDTKPAILIAHPPPPEFGMEFSSFPRLCRVVAWILYFYQKTRKQLPNDSPSHLTAGELKAAKFKLLLVSQLHIYSVKISHLQKKQALPTSHSLSNLASYLDSMGLIRVGGRLSKAGLAPQVAHPVMLSIRSHTTKLLVENTHHLALHAGPTTTMALQSCSYYIPTVKCFLKGLSQRCVPARRPMPKPQLNAWGSCLLQDHSHLDPSNNGSRLCRSIHPERR